MARSLEEIAAQHGNKLAVISVRHSDITVEEKYLMRAADTYLGENSQWVLMQDPIVNPPLIEDPGV